MMLFLILLLILNFSSEQKFTSFAINYGSGEQDLGLLLEPKTPPIGPCAFSVDGEGNIYIADPVNSAIKVFSQKKLLKIITFKGLPDDIAVSKNGEVYVLDRTSSEIFRINSTGRIDSFEINKKFSKEPSKFILWKGEIFIKGESKLSSLSFTDSNWQERIPYFYYAEFIDKVKGAVKKVDNNGKKILKFFVERENLVSIEFLNEDVEGNIYIQIEYLVSDNSVGLEVLKFNASGELISKIPIPENDYTVWTSRLLFVDENGRIFQVLPKREFVRINVWE